MTFNRVQRPLGRVKNSDWVCGGLRGSESNAGQPAARPADAHHRPGGVSGRCWTHSHPIPSPTGTTALCALRMVQRIGRTGRAGQKGRAYSFFSERDCPRAPMLVKCIEKTGVAAPQFLHLEAKKAKTIKSRHKKKEQDEGEWPAGDGAANGGTEWWAAEAAEEPAAEAQAQAPAPQSATEEGAEAGAEVVEVVPVQPIKETKEKKDKEKKKEKAPAADGEVDGGAMEGGAEAGAGDLEVVPVQPIKEKKEKKDKEKKKEKASAADGEVDGGEAGAENGLPGEKKKKKSSEGDAEAEVPEKKAKKARRL